MKLELELTDLKKNSKYVSVDNAQTKTGYAAAVKHNNESVLIIKPIKEKSCKETKDEIRKKFNPQQLGVNITKLKHVSKGAVVIGCDKKEDIKVKT